MVDNRFLRMNLPLSKTQSILINSIKYAQKGLIGLSINWMVFINQIKLMQLSVALAVHVSFNINLIIFKNSLHNSFHTSVNDFLSFFVQLNKKGLLKSGDLVKKLWCSKLLAFIDLFLNPSKIENFLPLLFSQPWFLNEILKLFSTHSLFAHIQKMKPFGWNEEVFDLSEDLWR